MKSIKTDEFFKLVATNSGVDIQTTQDVFYGMIKTISRELKNNHIIKLPDWGEFALKIRKIQKGYDINTRSQVPRSPAVVIKFTPDYKVKKYFNEFKTEGL